MLRLADDLGLWLLLGAPLGALWLWAVVDCVRQPGAAFARGLSRGTWLALLVLTGFAGALGWLGRRALSRGG